jgi:hypothetical protein
VGVRADGTKLSPTSYVALTRLATFAQTVVSVRFRPILDMMVTDFSLEEGEYEAETGWSIDLEEV